MTHISHGAGIRRPGGLLAILCGAVVLAACSSPAATAQPSASASASASVQASDPASSAPPDGGESPAAVDTPEPIPSAQLGEFTCDDLPVVEQATVAATANIVDVRVGTHPEDGYDRVVFEFTGGTPEISLDRAEPPFVQDGSGFPVEVEGESFLALVMRGGTKQQDDGTSSYDGPLDFDPEHPVLVDLVEGGDFEAQSTWYIGLARESCVRVTLLEDEPRVVVDIQH